MQLWGLSSHSASLRSSQWEGDRTLNRSVSRTLHVIPLHTHFWCFRLLGACSSHFGVHSHKRSESKNESPSPFGDLNLIMASVRSLSECEWQSWLTGSHSPAFSLTEVTELLGPFSAGSIYGALFWSRWKLLSPLHDRSIFSSSKSPFRSTRGVPRNLHEQVTYKQSGTSVPNKELYAQEQVGKALPSLLSWLRLAGSVKDTFPKCSALQLEAEVVRFLWGQGWPGLHSKLQTSQHFIVRPYLKQTNKII